MSKKQSSKDIMLAHSAAKVNFYQSYLERYLSVMSVTQYFDTINIFDVFCGRGEYDDGGLGSPIRAVQTIMKIKQDKPSDLKINLFLNDAEKEYVERVKKYIEEHFPDYNKYCNIKYLNYKADQLFGDICSFVSRTATNERNFIFVDPYGYKDINRSTLQRMMSNGRTEILLFLPISFMHRFRYYALNKEDKKAQRLKVFINEFFPPNHPVCLEEEMDVMDYIDALTEAFSFNNTYYTTNYFIERDARNYFALFFFCNNLLGLEKAVETKWALDSESGRGFHQQKKDANQLDMFTEWAKEERNRNRAEVLRLKIVGFLSTRERSNAEIYEFILRSGYKRSHANEVLRELQNNNQIEVRRTDLQKVRKGAFYLTYKESKDKLHPTAYIKLI